jgi:hypothetical protein
MPFHLVAASSDFPPENRHGCQKLAAHAPPLGALPGADESHLRRRVCTQPARHHIDRILAVGERLQRRGQFFAPRSEHGKPVFKVVPTCCRGVRDVMYGRGVFRSYVVREGSRPIFESFHSVG